MEYVTLVPLCSPWSFQKAFRLFQRSNGRVLGHFASAGIVDVEFDDIGSNFDINVYVNFNVKVNGLVIPEFVDSLKLVG